jgi:hypothetical protein
MFRSARDALNVLHELKDHDVSLHMIDLGGDVTGNGIAKMVFTILSAVAEAERDRTRERIVDVKRDQRSRGRYLGGAVPFGFRLGEQGELVPEPGEQAAIRHTCELKSRGASLRAIEAALTEQGHSVSHVAISSMLRRASNVAAGLLFALLLALSTARPAEATSCYSIRDMDKRLACPAEERRDPSGCTSIRDPDDRVVCQQRAGERDHVGRRR